MRHSDNPAANTIDFNIEIMASTTTIATVDIGNLLQVSRTAYGPLGVRLVVSDTVIKE